MEEMTHFHSKNIQISPYESKFCWFLNKNPPKESGGDNFLAKKKKNVRPTFNPIWDFRKTLFARGRGGQNFFWTTFSVISPYDS